MNAVVCTRYGPPEVLQLREVARPVPGARDVLIRVHAATATTASLNGRRGSPLFARLFTGLARPKKNVLGQELAGEIVAVGGEVTKFAVGDRVFGQTGFAFGAHAEFARLPESAALVPMPAGTTYDEAAAIVEGGLTALHFLRVGRVEEGQRILVNGASGSVGTAAVQVAKAWGAEVTGVCSAANAALVASLGADAVIDYTREDFTRSGRRYDVIFDAVGTSSFARCRRALTSSGIYLDAGKVSTLVPMLWTVAFGRKRARLAATYVRPASALADDLRTLKGMIEAGEVRAVIDRCYPLAELAEAHRYVETGRKKGNVVITLRPDAAERARPGAAISRRAAPR